MRGGGGVVHRGGGWSGSLEGRGVVNGRRRGVVNGSRGGGVIYERRRGSGPCEVEGGEGGLIMGRGGIGEVWSTRGRGRSGQWEDQGRCGL